MSGVRVVGPPDRPQVCFTANQNADFRANILLLSELLQPVDLAGAVATFAIKIENEPDVALQVDCQITDGAIEVVITAAQHAQLAVATYLFDLVLQIGATTPQLMEGTYQLVAGVAVI